MSHYESRHDRRYGECLSNDMTGVTFERQKMKDQPEESRLKHYGTSGMGLFF